MVRVWVTGKTVWSPCYICAISEHFRDKRLIIIRYINSSVYFTFTKVGKLTRYWYRTKKATSLLWRTSFEFWLLFHFLEFTGGSSEFRTFKNFVISGPAFHTTIRVLYVLSMSVCERIHLVACRWWWWYYWRWWNELLTSCRVGCWCDRRRVSVTS